MVIFGIMGNLRSKCMTACMAGLLVLTGCANFQITVPDSDPSEPGIRLGIIKRKQCMLSFGDCCSTRRLLPNATAKASMTL